MNFGKWIVVAFITFALYIGVLVGVCLKQDVNLVSKEYYQEELVYQTKLDRKENTNQLTVTPEIEVADGHVVVSFSGEIPIENGTLVMQRPSDQRLDRKFELSGPGRTQKFLLGAWEPGLYRASLTWRMGGKDYYIDKLIVL